MRLALPGPESRFAGRVASFLEIRTKSSNKFAKSEFWSRPGSPAPAPERIRRRQVPRRPSFLRLCRLAGPGARLGPQPIDLTPGQGDADLPDPFQLYPVDWLGIKARQVDHGRGFSAFDGFQVAFAGLQPDRGLLTVEA